MKKLFILLVFVLCIVSLFSCGEKKILHCDKCNAEVKVSAKSDMDEDWGILCEKCDKEVFGQQ